MNDLSPFLFSPISDICQNRGEQSQYKKYKCKNIYKFSAHIQSGQRFDEKFYIGRGHIIKAQFHSNLPVPFCTGAETKTIPYSQNKPGKGR